MFLCVPVSSVFILRLSVLPGPSACLPHVKLIVITRSVVSSCFILLTVILCLVFCLLPLPPYVCSFQPLCPVSVSLCSLLPCPVCLCITQLISCSVPWELQLGLPHSHHMTNRCCTQAILTVCLILGWANAWLFCYFNHFKNRKSFLAHAGYTETQWKCQEIQNNLKWLKNLCLDGEVIFLELYCLRRLWMVIEKVNENKKQCK